VLSDSFQVTPLRRGMIANRDFANGTEIFKIAFEQMLNYSSPMAPGVSVDQVQHRTPTEWLLSTIAHCRCFVL
jgi:hypothetical protein